MSHNQGHGAESSVDHPQNLRQNTSDDTLQDTRRDQTEKQKDNSDEGADKENDGDQDAPPLPVGFWHPSLRKTRLEVAGKWAMTTAILMAFILAVLGLYWGVLFKVQQNMKSLTTIVVDFDSLSAPYDNVQPLVGPVFVQAARMLSMKPEGVIGWTILDASEFNYDPIAVREYIYSQHAWAAIIVNNNATALLQEAVATGNQSYDPLGVAQTIYVEARDQTTIPTYILPQLTQFQTEVTSMFGKQWVASVLMNTSLDATTYQNAPQALSPAIGFSMFNLRPFMPATATPAVSIGLIYLIIIAFFSFSFYMPIWSKFIMAEGHAPLRFWQLTLYRLGLIIMTYFFLSLAYSLVSLAFQIPFSKTANASHVDVAVIPDAYGKASFVVYWMLNFVGMIALGLASENVTMMVGQPWTALWLIFWVISNVSTSFYEISLAPGFFRWGYAWPLHNIVEASRTILFDTHSRIGLNFGVLFAWCAINVACYFPAAVFFRWQNNKENMKKAPRSNRKFLLDG